MTYYRWIFAGALAIVATGCSQTRDLFGSVLEGAPKPQVSIERGRVTDLDLQSLTMTFDAEVKNPYSVPLPLTAMRYELGAGENAQTPFLTGFAENQGSVPAKGTKVLEVPVRVEFEHLLSSLQDIKPGMVVPYRANLSFEVEPPGTTEPLALPVSHSGELPVPAPPEVSVEQIQWENLSLARANGIVKMNIKNPNDFSAKLQDMTYNLKLNGTSLVQGNVEKDVNFGSNKTQSIEVPVSIRPLDLGTALFQALQGGQADYTVEGLVDFETPFGDLKHNYDRAGKLNLSR